MSVPAVVRVGHRTRVRVRVRGTVQGVGFRPYVYRLAGELALAGFVFNDAHGVVAEVEGCDAAVDAFLARLGPEAPPLAVVEEVVGEARPACGESAFAIRESPHGGVPDAPITPDTAACPDCLRELRDPADRRFRYPFINCTNCGPRFTIVRGVPYDRPLTTMAGFAMCADCRAEYEDPADRRFHAQPNACPRCGPRVALVSRGGAVVAHGGGAADPVTAAAAALRAGAVLAVKGIGGYHLACRADDETAVAALRARKHREDKPFALMAADVTQAQRLVVLGDGERGLMEAPERPIVLAPRRADAPVAAAVAPGAPELGVVLPYSPLHHLLLADTGAPLVMTSGNVSDEPIAYRDDDARARLAAIADLFLVHDRPIETRTDDSVVRMGAVSGAPQPAFLRRSRGYVPAALALGDGGTPRPLLACGAELKSTFCVAKGERAWVSHHIGDLENYETLRSFTDGIGHFQELFAVTPEVVAHDLHPEYLSTKYALERDGVELIGVQHHHAHLAACLAEYGETAPAVGAIFDGTGYGTDGTVWGGEFLFGDVRTCARVGTLLPVPLPGGAAAIRQPWRMACAWLWAAVGAAPALPGSLAGAVSERSWAQVGRLVQTGTASPMTTSMGRLCDAVGALCGIRAQVTYEGQAAIELEAACDPGERGAYEMPVTELDGMAVIDPRLAIAAIAADVAAGAAVGAIAARFHRGVARATVDVCVTLAAAHRCERVALSGGVFQNRRLLESVCAELHAAGLRVLVPQRLPVNDGGIAYGQAAVAAATLRAR
ncbi:MAG TPA: carbamoyltransferase HypF [Solirubrobacteraceae bacterium]|nr:carbamoyltransferase HypF [Solirubrobacteraceae bacterium]